MSEMRSYDPFSPTRPHSSPLPSLHKKRSAECSNVRRLAATVPEFVAVSVSDSSSVEESSPLPVRVEELTSVEELMMERRRGRVMAAAAAFALAPVDRDPWLLSPPSHVASELAVPSSDEEDEMEPVILTRDCGESHATAADVGVVGTAAGSGLVAPLA